MTTDEALALLRRRSLKQRLGRTPERIAAVLTSIAEHGYDSTRPILITRSGLIIDGHHRAVACQLLGVEPAIRLVPPRSGIWHVPPPLPGVLLEALKRAVADD